MLNTIIGVISVGLAIYMLDSMYVLVEQSRNDDNKLSISDSIKIRAISASFALASACFLAIALIAFNLK